MEKGIRGGPEGKKCGDCKHWVEIGMCPVKRIHIGGSYPACEEFEE